MIAAVCNKLNLVFQGVACFKMTGIQFKDTQRIVKMNKRSKIRICYVLLAMILLVTLPACSKRERRAFYEADISDTQIDSLRISRYEKVLFRLNPFVLREEIEPYREEFSIFIGHDPVDDLQTQRLFDFITDPFVIDLYLDSKEMWEKHDNMEEILNQAFRYYKYHFPDHEIPHLYTYISGVDYMSPVKVGGNKVVIGLDTYLGPGYTKYDELAIPRYISRWMRPERMIVDVMRTMADARLEETAPEAENLLEHMIYYGKRQFLLDCLLPRTHDSLKIAYTHQQLEWMNKYESYAWTYKIDNDLLYTTDHRTINNFMGDAPFTSVFGNQSAPRTGVYIGWQIVRNYMRRNPDITVGELLAESDARRILSGARYRP